MIAGWVPESGEYPDTRLLVARAWTERGAHRRIEADYQHVLGAAVRKRRGASWWQRRYEIVKPSLLERL